MANSKVASLTEPNVYGGGLIDDGNCRASMPSLEAGWADGLRSPSIRSSVSQNVSDGDNILRDPEAILRGLLSCDVGVEAAVQVVLGYYSAASGRAAPESPSCASGASITSARTQRWHDEMESWPNKRGHCYLKPVRWARRRRIGNMLRECPSMQDFISYITPEDIDVEQSKRINVYRLPGVGGGTSVAYHMAESYDAGIKVGSFRAVVQSLLKSYPWLNSRDFGTDSILPGNLPLVGRLAACDEIDCQLQVTQSLSGNVDGIRQEELNSSRIRLTERPLVEDVILDAHVGAESHGEVEEYLNSRQRRLLPAVGNYRLRSGLVPVDDMLRLRCREAVNSVIAASANSVLPVMSSQGFGFTAVEDGVSVVVSMKFVEAGASIYVPFSQTHSSIRVYLPGTVEIVANPDLDHIKVMSGHQPHQFLRQHGCSERTIKLKAVTSTVETKIHIDTGGRDHGQWYAWWALVDSLTLHVTAVDSRFLQANEPALQHGRNASNVLVSILRVLSCQN